MRFNFNCPLCGQSISVDNSLKGKIKNCPACQRQIRIPTVGKKQKRPRVSTNYRRNDSSQNSGLIVALIMVTSQGR